jgi:exoribonuclease R
MNNNKNILICGILHISSKISYGATKNGIIKKFTSHYPYNGNKIFHVKTKKDFQATDIYSIIRIEDLDKDSEKIPTGIIETYIGNIGDLEAERLYLQYLCTLEWMNDKYFPLIDYSNIDIYESSRIDLTSIDNIYSIDPHGCTDIDDALHIKDLGNNTYEIGIHISDVSSYIPINSPLDIELQKRGETLYLPYDDKLFQKNMLPSKLVTLCSLTHNSNKKCSSIIITIRDNKIINVNFIKSLITVNQNMSYDYAHDLIQNDSNDTIKLLYDIGQILYPIYVPNNDNYDIHKTVEVYMIMANVVVAEHLSMIDETNVLLRSHKGQTRYINVNSENKELTSYANNLLMSRAEYCIGASLSSIHIGLNQKYYTHFTSPIRRYADIIIHRMLYNNEKYITNQEIVDHINLVHKRHDKCERQSSNIHKLFNCVLKYGKVIDITGYIGYIDDLNKKIRVLIKDSEIIELNGFDIEKRLVDRQLDKLVTYEFGENNIIIKVNDKQIEFKLFDTIILKIAIVLTRRNKIFVQIMDPNIMELFDELNQDYNNQEDQEDSEEEY